MADESTPLSEAPAAAPASEDDAAQSTCYNSCSQNVVHVHKGLAYHTAAASGILDIPANTDEARTAENKSWEGAEIKWSPLIVKGVLATILASISVFVTYDGWVSGEVDTSNMFIFKCLATALSVFLTFPQLYQTTLFTLTFVALATDDIFNELQQRRHPAKVLLVAVCLIIVLPFTLPILILAVSVLQPILKAMGITQIYGLEVDDMALVIVGLIDFMQTLVLIPLGFVVVFSSAGPEDILVNVVAVQVFASLDDEFVGAFASPVGFKYDALETYCQKPKEEEEEEEDLSEWEGKVEARGMPVAAKGFLASIFIALGAYVGYDSIPDFLANCSYLLPFKGCMAALLVMQVVPQLYGTTNTALTFIAVARGKVFEELKEERGFLSTIFLAFMLFLFLPVVLPLLLVLGPILKPTLRACCDVQDYWLVVVGLIDVLQTVILFPLGVIIIFAADCATDIYIYFVVVLVFATMDDDFVSAFSDPNAQKIEALEMFCEKKEEEKPSSVAPDPHPTHPTRPGTGPKTRFVMRDDGGFHEHGSQ